MVNPCPEETHENVELPIVHFPNQNPYSIGLLRDSLLSINFPQYSPTESTETAARSKAIQIPSQRKPKPSFKNTTLPPLRTRKIPFPPTQIRRKKKKTP